MDDDAQRLRTIMDLQDDIIIITDGHHLEYINNSFFKFSQFEDFKAFKKLHNCICELFIDMEDNSYLKSANAEEDWIIQLQKNPNKEFFVVIKNAKGINTLFKVNFKQFDTAKKSYMLSLHDATLYKENLDLINLISNMQGVYFTVTSMNGKLLKISQSLLHILKIEDFREDNYSITDFLNTKDKELAMQHIATNDSSAYEVTIRYREVLLPILVQGYFGIVNNIPVRVAVIMDMRKLKELQNEAKKRDILLFQQAKMAQMGEMINMIAHQWRQPLNAISAASIQSAMKLQLNQFNKDDFNDTQNFIQNQCQNMSAVINTFMEYASAKQKEENFLFVDAFNIVFSLVKQQFIAHSIKIFIEDNNQFEIKGAKDMLEQVVLNLLMNARDAYDEQKEMEDKVIYIKSGKDMTIEIIDYAGGISEKIIDKVFMPYFTTKEQGKGTGIGLYMSKKIMKEHFKGDLFYEKLANGSKFILDFKMQYERN